MEDSKSIVIRGFGAISPLGCNESEIRASYVSGATKIKQIEVEGKTCFGATLGAEGNASLEALTENEPRYRSLDRTVLMAIYASRVAFQRAGWESDVAVAANLASSRGATGLFEKYYRSFLESERGRANVLASPTTTLGNISSWVLQDLKLHGAPLSHSITCSSAIQAIANAFAWLKSGLIKRVLAGASEAPLTAFTISQMQALKVYASAGGQFPCRPLAVDVEKECGMVLGEGAAVAALEWSTPQKGDLIIAGFGLASEKIESATSISDEGEALTSAMSQALRMCGEESVDAVILHAPGTQHGDSAELAAVSKVFNNSSPQLLSNKWIIGHTFGAAGALNLEYAILVLQGLEPPQYPYPVRASNGARKIGSVMINATGFGGNAGSLIVKIAQGSNE